MVFESLLTGQISDIGPTVSIRRQRRRRYRRPPVWSKFRFATRASAGLRRYCPSGSGSRNRLCSFGTFGYGTGYGHPNQSTFGGRTNSGCSESIYRDGSIGRSSIRSGRAGAQRQLAGLSDATAADYPTWKQYWWMSLLVMVLLEPREWANLRWFLRSQQQTTLSAQRSVSV